MSETERKRYEKYLINYIRDRDVFRTALQEVDEKGFKIGIEQGERKKGIEFTIKLIRKGFDNETNSELTGSPINEIKELRNQTEVL